jgi:single-strand DNA-binding protein
MIIIAGAIAKELEMKYSTGGKPYVIVSVPVKERWTGGDGQAHEVTTWFKSMLWEKTAELVNKWAKKGSIIQIVGKMDCDATTGAPKIYSKQDGTAGTSFEIKCDTITLLALLRAKEEANGEPAPAGPLVNNNPQPGEIEIPGDDDIPF